MVDQVFLQMSDEGAVIGYAPNSEYSKGISATEQENSGNIEENTEEESNYSRAYQYFAENLPKNTFINLAFAKNNVLKSAKQVMEAFSVNEYDSYSDISAFYTSLVNGNTDFVNSFVEYYSEKPNGSVVPEIVKDIYDSYKRIDAIDRTLRYLYYGSETISDEDAAEIDNLKVKTIKNLEDEEEYHKINYMAISMDSALNKLSSLYSFNTSKACMMLAGVCNSAFDFEAGSTSKRIVQKIFDEVNDKILSRRKNYENQQNVEILQKTLYNYYYKRQDLIDLYNLAGGTDNIFVGTKVVEYQQRLYDSIENVAKAYLGHKVYINKITELEREKYMITQIYSQISDLNA